MFKVKSNEPQIIMGIDPSLSNTGIVIVNRLNGNKLLLSRTITFTTKDKKDFVKDMYEKGMIPVKEVNKTTDEKIRQFVNNQWNIYRLGTLYKEIDLEIKTFDVDTVITEIQVKNIDLTQCVGYIKALAGMNKCFYDNYEPKRWKKLLTTTGDADENLLRRYVVEYYPLLEKHMDEHQIDAFCIMLTYLKQNDLSFAVN